MAGQPDPSVPSAPAAQSTQGGIATGNWTPSFRVMPDGTIRPVYLFAVDAAEFVVNKLLDRGSLSATTMVTNVQDFIGKVATGLGVI